ncbi:MAG: putative toxin-antitoxin system toxin component, PIN family [Betaproteobacteria bacterium]
MVARPQGALGRGRSPHPSRAPRVVFDTGVIVSALVFKGGQLDWLRDDWRESRSVPLVSPATANELLRVLLYPKFRLTEAEREELLAEFLPYAETFNNPRGVKMLPRCRDPQDRMFLELAAAARADALVSGDADLLVLAPDFAVPILSPSVWRERRP